MTFKFLQTQRKHSFAQMMDDEITGAHVLYKTDVKVIKLIRKHLDQKYSRPVNMQQLLLSALCGSALNDQKRSDKKDSYSG